MKKADTPVTIADVEEAYNQLIEEGVKPSIRLLRERVGRGSFSTIQTMLRKVMDGIVTPEDELKSFEPRLKDLCSEMVFHIDELAKSRTAEAREEIENARANLEAEGKKLRDKLEVAVLELKYERASNADLRKSVDRELKENMELRQEVKAGTATAAQLKSELAASEGRAKELIASLDRVQEQRTHFEAMTARQRIEEEEKFANAIAGYQQTIEKMRAADVKRGETLASATAVNAQLQHRLDEQTSQLNETKNELEAERQKKSVLEKENGFLKHEIEKLKASEDAALDGAAELRKKLAEQEEVIAAMTAKIHSVQAEIIQTQREADAARNKRTSEGQQAIATLLDHAMKACKLAGKVIGPDNREMAMLQASQQQLESLFRQNS